ncbi:MAG TPA: hypothetical protein VGD60_06835 [Candidatus Acidoferrales bacterium]
MRLRRGPGFAMRFALERFAFCWRVEGGGEPPHSKVGWEFGGSWTLRDWWVEWAARFAA